MKIQDFHDLEVWHEVPLTNPLAVASVERLGWRWDPRCGGFLLRADGQVDRGVSLALAERANFDVLDFEYCDAVGLPATDPRSDPS